jgi:hypothetical protein
MNREETDIEVIDLGVASVDTKGSLVTIDDEEGGFRPAFGLERRLKWWRALVRRARASAGTTWHSISRPL